MFCAGDGEGFVASTSMQRSRPCRLFEFPEILSATKNFDESLVIGHGGFGKVYRGTVFNGHTPVLAAIKRLDFTSDQGASEFWAEVESLSMLRHCHLVSLFGYCNHEKEMILVYEYMPNGALEDHLHKLDTPLSWIQRLTIAIGAARGLDYLHTGTGVEFGIIHRDVKSSNILLHETWAAKISDFGLSKIGPTNQPTTYVNTLVKGTFGYLDPDYFSSGRLTRKSDVYAFGVVLLELLCRKRAVDRSLDEDQWGLAPWAQDSIKEGKLKQIIDSDIRDQLSPKCLKEFVRIADRCLHIRPKQRPTMSEVVVSLQSALTLQKKSNNSLQASGRTIFGRMLYIFPFSTSGDPSAHENSTRAGNTVELGDNMLLETEEDPADCRIPSPSLKLLKYDDLRSATKNFSQDLFLDEDDSGKVFLGRIDKNIVFPSSRGAGIAVAINKRNHIQGHDEWLAEVALRERLAHPNIASLVGYCNDEHNNLLIYQYMQNRSFDLFLFKKAPYVLPLSWGTRLNIMMGVAQGLAYLHSFKDQSIHLDIKSSNIFLDVDFNAKVGDFGLEKSGRKRTNYFETRAINYPTDGELQPPEYVCMGQWNRKSDIYRFGVVLLESLTGVRGIDGNRPTHQVNLITWTSPILARKRHLMSIMDPRLTQNCHRKSALRYAGLIRRCLQANPTMRPSSAEVLQSLEQISAISMEPLFQTD